MTITSFNPRPLLLTGESRPVVLLIITPQMFQSTPVIANGRIVGGEHRSGRSRWSVSIHARYC